MSKDTKKNRDRKWYGMKKLKTGGKVCWFAKENKNGWALGLALNEGTLWLRHFRAASEAEIKRIVKSSIVFSHSKK